MTSCELRHWFLEKAFIVFFRDDNKSRENFSKNDRISDRCYISKDDWCWGKLYATSKQLYVPLLYSPSGNKSKQIFQDMGWAGKKVLREEPVEKVYDLDRPRIICMPWFGLGASSKVSRRV